MSRPNQTVILLKIDYKDIKNKVETLSSAQDHCYMNSLSK